MQKRLLILVFIIVLLLAGSAAAVWRVAKNKSWCGYAVVCMCCTVPWRLKTIADDADKLACCDYYPFRVDA